MNKFAVWRGPTLVVEPVNPSAFTAEQWDRFAIACGASMRSAHAHLRWLQVRLLTKGRVRTFGIYNQVDGDRRLIGHATVLFGRRGRRFYNGLNILPEFSALWTQAMEALLARIGPGDFEYGWSLSLEPSRDAELGAIAGIRDLQARRVDIHAVDFSQWPSWEAYHRDISENNRRNARKVEQSSSDLRVTLHSGLAALGAAATLTRMRTDMYRRKGLSFRPLRIFAGYLTSILLAPPQILMARVVADGRVLAAYNGVEFGGNHYYLDGASSSHMPTGGSYLLMAMLRRAYERNPTGKFIMGYIVYPMTREMPEGLLRSRRAVRATDWHSSITTFSWAHAADQRRAEAAPDRMLADRAAPPAWLGTLAAMTGGVFWGLGVLIWRRRLDARAAASSVEGR